MSKTFVDENRPTRSQLQVDASTELKQQLKFLAASKGMTLKEVVMHALVETYPELTHHIQRSLGLRK